MICTHIKERGYLLVNIREYFLMYIPTRSLFIVFSLYTHMIINYTECRLKYIFFSFHRSEHEASFSFDQPGYDSAVDNAALTSSSSSTSWNIHLSVHETSKPIKKIPWLEFKPQTSWATSSNEDHYTMPFPSMTIYYRMCLDLPCHLSQTPLNEPGLFWV